MLTYSGHYRSVGYWSTSELNLAVICACMPGISSLISFVLPRVKGDTTRGASKGTGYGTGNSSGPSYVKRSRSSREFFDKADKDFIPLVESQSFNRAGGTTEPDKAWPLSESRAL